MEDKIKRPNEVIIGSLKWKIVWDRKLVEGTFGICDYSVFEIAISDFIKNEDVKKSTLLHEILHAASFNYGFHVPDGGKSKREEAFVSFASSVIYDILMVNPDVKNYIFN
jgi:hypothetical protein